MPRVGNEKVTVFKPNRPISHATVLLLNQAKKHFFRLPRTVQTKTTVAVVSVFDASSINHLDCVD